jgi:hypothetical protein
MSPRGCRMFHQKPLFNSDLDRHTWGSIESERDRRQSRPQSELFLLSGVIVTRASREDPRGDHHCAPYWIANSRPSEGRGRQLPLRRAECCRSVAAIEVQCTNPSDVYRWSKDSAPTCRSSTNPSSALRSSTRGRPLQEKSRSLYQHANSCFMTDAIAG